jgi:hypothetical protein
MAKLKKKSPFSFLIVIVFTVLAGCDGWQNKYGSEGQYYKLRSSRCTVEQAAGIIRNELLNSGVLPSNEKEAASLIWAHKNEIRCGPDLAISITGAFVDTYGSRLHYELKNDTALIYSDNVPSEISNSDAPLFGISVAKSGLSEARVNAKQK